MFKVKKDLEQTVEEFCERENYASDVTYVVLVKNTLSYMKGPKMERYTVHGRSMEHRTEVQS